MKLKNHFLFISFLITQCFFSGSLFAQSYTNYFTGDTTDVTTAPQKGVVLMGGAGEDDNAMKWFLERADGGDILVLRTDDSDGYNDYLFSDLGTEVNSVETIVCNSAEASADPYVITQIKNAEAIWFAGGDQWNYVSYWRDTEVEDALNYCVNEKGITLGGISAGMAIQGQIIFTAENGSITSFQALSNPFANLLTLAYDDFIDNALMDQIITDTHFDERNRRGRTTAFLARILNDYGFRGYAIACNEYTAVCIDENRIAYAFGTYPDDEDYVYFVQVNCIEPYEPEVIEDAEQLTWDRNDAALKVIKAQATTTGSTSLDLKDWETITGGYTWENWWVEDGTFHFTEEATPLNCADTAIFIQTTSQFNKINVFPNPAEDVLHVTFDKNLEQIQIHIFSASGKLSSHNVSAGTGDLTIPVFSLSAGVYYLQFQAKECVETKMFIKE
ncbi:MAG: T9SS type A sorting domain-containing protein [Chitinophagales bacterium]|nr:T9SS type A sorting domain-containing protein [Chitinophagales bacterium]